jgi:hypothetical protein
MKRALGLLGLLVLMQPAGAASDRYWEWGYGYFAPYLSNSIKTVGELDLARWDWLDVEVNSPATVELMNRLLEINPKLKFLVRIWPINGMGIPDYHSHLGSCLDYVLYPEKKKEINQRTRDGVRYVREGLKSPQNVVGYCFLEEIPGAWGLGSLMSYQGEGPLPRPLEFHKEALEKHRGKPLVWDAEMKQWLGRQMVESLAELHKIIKNESGGKPVFYWHHTNFATLDDLPEPRPADFDLVKWRGYPIRFAEIIKPGLCDGFMAYPNSAKVWEEKYMRQVRANNWLYFSQLSHPSFMRLCAWPEAVKLVQTKMPQNLGTFIYCEGSCAARKVWNDDTSLPADPAWHQRWLSMPLHARHLARQFNVGMDVVRCYHHLRVSLDAKLQNAKPGDIFHLVGLIENPLDETYFNTPEEAVAREVKVNLTLPPGIIADPAHSAPTELPVGDMPGGSQRLVDWWLTVKDPAALKAGQPITVKATSASAHPGQAQCTGDVSFPSLQPQPIARSGFSWDENGFRYGGLRPVIEIRGQGEPIKNPTLTDGTNTVTWTGELWAGLKLVITPDLKARLYADNLLAGREESLKDPNDPTGYKRHSEGYLVASTTGVAYLRPGTKYRLSISGQAAEGGNSLVVLRAVKPDREVWQPSVLANRFGAKWAEPAQVIEIPSDVTSLQRLYLYRFQSKGQVWYGPLSLTPEGIPAEGLDVSDKLTGRPLQIGQGMLTRFTYRDESPDGTSAKVEVQLYKPQDVKLGPGVQQGF